MKNPMTIEQTVEIPANHRLTIEVPPEIPAGKAILAFTPAGEARPRRDKAKSFRGILKGRGISLDRFMEMRREDKVLEDETDEKAARQ